MNTAFFILITIFLLMMNRGDGQFAPSQKSFVVGDAEFDE